MLELVYYENIGEKLGGYCYHCCELEDTEGGCTINIYHREANYEAAKREALKSLRELRDELTGLIEREESTNEYNIVEGRN